MKGFLKYVVIVSFAASLACCSPLAFAAELPGTSSEASPASDSLVVPDSSDVNSDSSVVPPNSSSIAFESTLSTPESDSTNSAESSRSITTKRLNDYTVTEALLLILVCIAVLALFVKIFGL